MLDGSLMVFHDSVSESQHYLDALRQVSHHNVEGSRQRHEVADACFETHVYEFVKVKIYLLHMEEY